MKMMPAKGLSVFALAVFAVGLWATGALPEHITALAFFLIATSLRLIRARSTEAR